MDDDQGRAVGLALCLGPEHGNLATLEDEDDADAAMPSGAGGARRPAVSRAPADGVPAPRSPSDPARGSDLAPGTSRRRYLAIGIAVLLALAAASRAWFTRLISHR